MTRKGEGPTGQGKASKESRKSKASKLNTTKKDVPAQAKSPKQSGNRKKARLNFDLSEQEPWDEAVDGADLLDDLHGVFPRHLALPEGAAEAMAFWVLFTHAFDAAEVSPRLALTSPTRGCGKTTALTILSHLVRRPLPASNWTAATVFRSIERNKPTLLIDEADTFLADAEGLRGILNSGHTQGMAYVMRSVGKDYKPYRFSTWAPMAMAKIGCFPATLEERSIMIRMQKRRPDEVIERFRPNQTADLEELARKAARWGKDHIDVLRQADPTMPKGLSDRAADNWRPLFAIADAAGGHWPETARHVALQLPYVSSGASSTSPGATDAC